MPVQTAQFPATIPNFTTKVDQVDYVLAEHVDQLQLEVIAIATAIGTNPRGSAANLRERVVALENQLGGLSIPAQETSNSWHIAGALTTGLKIPKWVLPRNATLRFAMADLDLGTDVQYQIWVNGALPDGHGSSDLVSAGAVDFFDFTDLNVNARDKIQIYISNAGNGASDLSITVDAYWR